MSRTRTLKVKIPEDLARDLDHILGEQKLTLDEVATIYLRAMVNTSKSRRTLGLDDVVQFGRHKGTPLGLLIRAEPDYVQYCLANVRSFSISPEAMELLGKTEVS